MIKFNNGEYSGEEFNGLPNGYGEFVFNNGDRYVGHFYDGKIDGSGTLTRSNGNVISGEFSNGEIIKGSCKYASGILFEGYFKNGSASDGKITYTNGDKFEGVIDFSKNYKKGTYYYKSGAKYVGEMVNGLKHGNGVEYQGDATYEGLFENDLREGVFTITTSNGTTRATYRSDVLNGYFKSVENGVTYEGNYVNDKEDGSWKVQKNGETYYLKFKNGKLVENNSGFNYKNQIKTTSTKKPANLNFSGNNATKIVKFDNSNVVKSKSEQSLISEFESEIVKITALKNEFIKIEKYAKTNLKKTELYTNIDGLIDEYDAKAYKMICKPKLFQCKVLKNFDIIYGKHTPTIFGDAPKLHGFGVYNKGNEHFYVGNFVNGRLNGLGYYYKIPNYEQTIVYFGEYKDNVECGDGVKFKKNCRIFGNCVDGKYIGVGKIEFDDKSLYIGELNLNGMTGDGVLYLPNKSKIIANRVGSKYCKKYMQVNADGSYEIAKQSKDGKIDGVYVKYDKNDNLICAYTYKNGVKNGPCKYLISDNAYGYKTYSLNEESTEYKNSECQFVGVLDKNGFAKIGTAKFSDGSVYSGTFTKGVLNGKNVSITFANGDKFEGEVENGEMKMGTIEFKKPHGGLFKKFSGAFEKGIPYGFGKFYYASSEMWCEGFVKNGLPNGSGVLHHNDLETKYNFVNGLF